MRKPKEPCTGNSPSRIPSATELALIAATIGAGRHGSAPEALVEEAKALFLAASTTVETWRATPTPEQLLSAAGEVAEALNRAVIADQLLFDPSKDGQDADPFRAKLSKLGIPKPLKTAKSVRQNLLSYLSREHGLAHGQETLKGFRQEDANDKPTYLIHLSVAQGLVQWKKQRKSSGTSKGNRRRKPDPSPSQIGLDAPSPPAPVKPNLGVDLGRKDRTPT